MSQFFSLAVISFFFFFEKSERTCFAPDWSKVILVGLMGQEQYLGDIISNTYSFTNLEGARDCKTPLSSTAEQPN